MCVMWMAGKSELASYNYKKGLNFQHHCSCSWMMKSGYANKHRPDLAAEWGVGGLAWKILEFLRGPLDYAIRITPNDSKPRLCGDLWCAIRVGDNYKPSGSSRSAAPVIAIDVDKYLVLLC